MSAQCLKRGALRLLAHIGSRELLLMTDWGSRPCEGYLIAWSNSCSIKVFLKIWLYSDLSRLFAFSLLLQPLLHQPCLSPNLWWWGLSCNFGWITGLITQIANFRLFEIISTGVVKLNQEFSWRLSIQIQFLVLSLLQLKSFDRSRFGQCFYLLSWEEGMACSLAYNHWVQVTLICYHPRSRPFPCRR